MKRLFWLVLFAGLVFSQSEASKAVPVTVLGYDLNVVWPAPTLQIFGPECDASAQEGFSLARSLEPRIPDTVEKYACYLLMAKGADKQAATVNFIAGYTRQGAGYTLTFEQSDISGRLVQVWEKGNVPALVYIFTFTDEGIKLLVGRLELIGGSAGS